MSLIVLINDYSKPQAGYVQQTWVYSDANNCLVMKAYSCPSYPGMGATICCRQFVVLKLFRSYDIAISEAGMSYMVSVIHVYKLMSCDTIKPI